jgi:hypothetical protein
VELDDAVPVWLPVPVELLEPVPVELDEPVPAEAVDGGLLLRVAVGAELQLLDADVDAVALRVLVGAAVPDTLAL